MASREIEDLKPETQEKIIRFENRLVEAGLCFKRSCTYRSQAEQNALWKRGRAPLQTVNDAYESVGLPPITAEQNKHAVTWKTVSNHTGRTAVDYYEANDGTASYDLKVDANHDHVYDWEQFGQIAEECGLRWGGRWSKPDYPHVEDPEA